MSAHRHRRVGVRALGQCGAEKRPGAIRVQCWRARGHAGARHTHVGRSPAGGA